MEKKNERGKRKNTKKEAEYEQARLHKGRGRGIGGLGEHLYIHFHFWTWYFIYLESHVLSWFVTNLIHLKWMRSTIAVSCPGRCAQHDRLFFSFPLLPRPPLSPPFSNTRCFLPFLLACLLCLLPFPLASFSFLSLLPPLLAIRIPAAGLFVCLFTTHSVHRLLLFAIVGCVCLS